MENENYNIVDELNELYLKDLELDEEKPFFEVGNRKLTPEEKDEYFKKYLEKKKDIKTTIKFLEKSNRYKKILDIIIHNNYITLDEIYSEIYDINVKKVHQQDRHHKLKW